MKQQRQHPETEMLLKNDAYKGKYYLPRTFDLFALFSTEMEPMKSGGQLLKKGSSLGSNYPAQNRFRFL